MPFLIHTAAAAAAAPAGRLFNDFLKKYFLTRVIDVEEQEVMVEEGEGEEEAAKKVQQGKGKKGQQPQKEESEEESEDEGEEEESEEGEEDGHARDELKEYLGFRDEALANMKKDLGGLMR